MPAGDEPNQFSEQSWHRKGGLSVDGTAKDIETGETGPEEKSHLDMILTSEVALIPSSGFLVAVMERVTEESRMPAPVKHVRIGFPWRRAVPGFVLAAVVFGWVGVMVGRWLLAGIENPARALPSSAIAQTLPMQEGCWILLALAISLGSWLLARRIAGLGVS
jgi:hypothetical protein